MIRALPEWVPGAERTTLYVQSADRPLLLEQAVLTSRA
jgi:hypothetical protein